MASKKPATVGRSQTRQGKAPVVATVIDADNAADAEAGYEKYVSGWSEIPERQRKEIIALSASYTAKPRPYEVTLKKSDSGKYSIGAKESEHPTLHTLKQAETFASASLYFSSDKLNDLINYFEANNNRGASELDINSALAFVAGAKPQNEVEATLAVQMAVTNDAAMRALRMVGKSDWMPQAQLFGNLAIKLLRTFTTQAEALAKLQRGGEQVVKHIHVDNRGGQAVIAETVTNGGSENAKIADQCQTAGTVGSISALPSPDPLGNGVPIPGREREAAMQDARGDESGRA